MSTAWPSAYANIIGNFNYKPIKIPALLFLFANILNITFYSNSIQNNKIYKTFVIFVLLYMTVKSFKNLRQYYCQ